MDFNFALFLVVIAAITAMLLAVAMVALLLGKSKETRQLIKALRDIFRNLK